MQRETNVGPLARGDLRDTLCARSSVRSRRARTRVTGGSSLDGKGYFYAPTVLDGVTDDMPAFREETFGPVAAVIRARDAEDAVRLANDTEYGLGAALWTADIERGKALARHIEAGSVFINGMVASDPRLPFGGIKRSGYGRELGAYGISEFVNIQTVVVGQPVAPGPAGRVNQARPCRRPSSGALADDYWEGSLRRNPVLATFYGDYRYNDRLPNIGPSGRAEEESDLREVLRRLEAIDPDASRGRGPHHVRHAAHVGPVWPRRPAPAHRRDGRRPDGGPAGLACRSWPTGTRPTPPNTCRTSSRATAA